MLLTNEPVVVQRSVGQANSDILTAKEEQPTFAAGYHGLQSNVQLLEVSVQNLVVPLLLLKPLPEGDPPSLGPDPAAGTPSPGPDPAAGLIHSLYQTRISSQLSWQWSLLRSSSGAGVRPHSWLPSPLLLEAGGGGKEDQGVLGSMLTALSSIHQ